MAESSEALVESIGEKTIDLKPVLAELPKHMILFSLGMRKLQIELQLTKENEHTEKVNEMSDAIQKQAVVYTKVFLPVVERAMRAISSFTEHFVDFDFEEMEECWEDALEDINILYRGTELLKQMHIKLIADVKACENESKITRVQIQEKQTHYDEAARKLSARQIMSTHASDVFAFAGIVLAAPTAGASLVLGAAGSAAFGVRAIISASEADKNKRDARIAQKMGTIIDAILLPALTNFFEGLKACSNYATTTRESLISMHDKGAKGGQGTQKKRQIYFNKMKKSAHEIAEVSQLCKDFIIMADEVRTDVASLPQKPEDNEYATAWMEESMQNFKADEISKYKQLLPQLKN